MTQRKANLLLASVSVVWGSSNLMLRLGLEDIETFNLIALRFCLAFLIVASLFHKELRNTSQKVLLYAALLGVSVYCNFTVLICALRLSTVSEVGFLNSISVVLVPVFCSIWRRELPNRNLLAAMVIVLLGLALMNLEEGIAISLGTWLALLAALVNAFVVILTDFTSHRVENTLQLGIWQIGFTGLCGLITSCLFETPRLPQTKLQWFAVLVLAVLCSAYGYVVRPIAQRYTTPEQTGFLLTLEPVFSAIFGFFVLHERLRFSGYIGAALVLASVPVANGAAAVFWQRARMRMPIKETKE